MNKVHRTLWNNALNAWVAVAENAKASGKTKTSKTLLATPLLAALTATGALAAPPTNPPATNALPTGGVVSAGTASLSQAGTTPAPVLNIHQSTPRAAINWNTFNIGQAATVNFNQPNAQSVTLNRVADHNPSQIFGKINATGQVYLVNPSGVYFSRTASVDVRGLVATTHSMSDTAFMAGGNTFLRNGATGRVENEGELKAKLDGYIALLAPEVVNKGVIVAERGTAVLANGESITLDFNADHKLSGIVVTASDIASLIENKHAIETPDGQIIMSAQSVSALRGSLIKNSGSLVANTGANSITRKGGRILLEGDEITLSGTSKIEAKGEQGGGTVLVGGDWQGSNGVYQATKTTIEAGATIDASATHNGDGGEVVVWSDIHNAIGSTAVSGAIRADGGPNGGNGGQIETSGYVLNTDGSRVTAEAPRGRAGNWLLDPYDYTLGSFSFGSTNVTIQTTDNTSCPGSISGCSVSGSVAVGNIIINGPVTSGGGNLTLIAGGGVTGNGAIYMNGGVLTINQTGDTSYGGLIDGAGTNFVKEGPGTLKFTHFSQYGGSNIVQTHGYTGTTTVRQGVLEIQQGMATSRVIVENGATYAISINNGTAHSPTYPITLSGTGVSGDGALRLIVVLGELGSPLTLVGDAGVSVPYLTTVTNSVKSLTAAGKVTGAGKLIKLGIGELVLNSNSNDYTGGTEIRAGMLTLAQPNALSTSGTIDFTGGTLKILT